ncbi:hypothetical protein HPULCUR_010808 [Helicostylum pulchrum]|uniref:Uncharacterized protein n=1 Tax=Helicostylum pulchrum TaxID=562976 RepID=A0ABP9YEB1_9FUNG
MSLAKELFNKLNARNRRPTSMHSESSSSVARVDKRNSNRFRSQANGRNFVRDSASSSSSDTLSSNQEFCTFHKSYGSHSTDACRAYKATQATPSNSGTTSPHRDMRSCRRCSAPNWTPNHKCSKSKGNADSSSVRYYGAPAPPTANSELTQRDANSEFLSPL